MSLPDMLAVAYRAAGDDAMTKTGLLDLPEMSPFNVEQALSEPPTDDSICSAIGKEFVVLIAGIANIIGSME